MNNNEFFEDGTPVNEKKSLWQQFKDWCNTNKEVASAIGVIGVLAAFKMFVNAKRNKNDINQLRAELLYQAGVQEGFNEAMEKVVDKLSKND